MKQQKVLVSVIAVCLIFAGISLAHAADTTSNTVVSTNSAVAEPVKTMTHKGKKASAHRKHHAHKKQDKTQDQTQANKAS